MPVRLSVQRRDTSLVCPGSCAGSRAHARQSAVDFWRHPGSTVLPFRDMVILRLTPAFGISRTIDSIPTLRQLGGAAIASSLVADAAKTICLGLFRVLSFSVHR